MGSGKVDLTALTSRLTEYNQQHLIKFWDQLSESERNQLYGELNSLDFAYVSRCFKECQEELQKAATAIDDQLQPLPESVVGSYVRTDAAVLQRYEDIGKIFLYLNYKNQRRKAFS
jgi:UDP-N-acetylglucosamine/UDP-N-acetylgalactosamine diphosphorylase